MTSGVSSSILRCLTSYLSSLPRCPPKKDIIIEVLPLFDGLNGVWEEYMIYVKGSHYQRTRYKLTSTLSFCFGTIRSLNEVCVTRYANSHINCSFALGIYDRMCSDISNCLPLNILWLSHASKQSQPAHSYITWIDFVNNQRPKALAYSYQARKMAKFNWEKQNAFYTALPIQTHGPKTKILSC